MYDYFRGILIQKAADKIVLELGGIGYLIRIPLSAFGQLPSIGEEITVFISLIIKDDSRELFGFLERNSRDLFEKLISFSGIGPKTGMNILGHFDEQALFRAVHASDIKSLSKIPGIGKKTAERLIIDLKSVKLPASESPALLRGGNIAEDACAALINLGYPRQEAQKLIEKAYSHLPDEPGLPELLHKALQMS